jgi:nucleoside-diphosphate-sugar epimerase
MAQVLGKQLATSPISKVIFISSTSVYSESNEILNEFSEIAPETESGQVLAETEALFLALKMQVILLRLAGLIGPNRMPGRFFAGRENIPNGLAPVNMIHLDDAVSLINCLIDSESAKGVYLGCSPSHPTKEEFYNLAAKVEKLVAPQFIPEKTKWKIISSDRTIQELNFQYKYNSLIDCLNETDFKS